MKKIRNFVKTLAVLRLKSAITFYWLKYLRGSVSEIFQFKLKNGLNLSVNKNAGDLTTFFEIFVNDDYPFAGDPNREINVLDIGANVGYFSLYISNRFPQAKVFSFEPFPDTFNRLKENIRCNPVKNIIPYQLAVSDYNGSSKFYSFEWAGCNTLIDRNLEESNLNTTTVECVAFDDIFRLTGAKEFTFGKIDCEGSEYRIFLNSNAESILSVKYYIIEVHQNDKFAKKDLIKKFEDLGYKLYDRGGLIEASLL